MIIRIINYVEFADFKAQFVGVSNDGRFDFQLCESPFTLHTMRHSLDDERPSYGMFGLPEFKDGDSICPNVHTVRLRCDFALDKKLISVATIREHRYQREERQRIIDGQYEISDADPGL